MKKLTLGGYDSRLKKNFAYYETIAGGMGVATAVPG
jgi:N-methylhydantoinase B/oxoprolinase/acetone carboxylase alpha subunit